MPDLEQHWGKCDAAGFFMMFVLVITFVVVGLFMAAPPPADFVRTEVPINAFGPYFDLLVPPRSGTMDQVPQGRVEVTFFGTSAELSWDLENLDERCLVQGPNPENSFSCGIHIHTNPTCENSTGAHYYNPEMFDSSPWFTSQYSGGSSGSSVVNFGYTYADTRERPLVVHAWDGSRIGCQQIAEQNTISVSGFSSFTTPPAADGTVLMTFSLTQVRLRWNLQNLDDACLTQGVDGAVNYSCGLVVYEATSCGTAADSPPFFNANRHPENPWLSSRMTAESGSVNVEFGEIFQDTLGRVLVVHNRAGAQVACTVISNAQTA